MEINSPMVYTLPFTLLELCSLGSFLFCLGVSGIIINRRSILFMLVNLELALLGIFLCFSFYSVVTLNPDGQLYAILILVAAAAESAIGLALVLL
jgi:NADH-quinone oxidoreductase subunit K